MGEWFGDVKTEALNNTKLINETYVGNQKSFNPLSSHKFGTTLTVFGVLLLDLDCDACQSPSRAYLLDVTDPSQHSSGLTTFTLMAGFGGCLGYFLGGIPWEHTFLTSLFGDHIHVLFTFIWIIYVICVISTLTASKESTGIINTAANLGRSASRQYLTPLENVHDCSDDKVPYEPLSRNDMRVSYFDYIRSIICMPSSLKWLCLTNFFCWMALVSYSLFFTDFVGQAVFGKNIYNSKWRFSFDLVSFRRKSNT